MKKFLFLAMAFCLGVFSHAEAETTDISSYDNVIYIEPVSVHAGTQHMLSIKMKNSVTAEGFEFILYLPTGISFNGDPILSTQRTTAEKTNVFNFTYQQDGALHAFGASTVTDAIINGNDGEVALVPILVDENMEPGAYTLTIKNGVVSGSDAQSYGPDEAVEIKTTITVTEPLANTILNETATTAPTSSGESVNVTVNRTIKANTWSTLCLPFDMTTVQVKEAFGDDVKLAELDSWSFTGTAPNIDAVQLKFASATSITANQPCLIQVSNLISSFEVKNVEIVVEDLPEVTKTYKVGKKNYSCSMYGYYSAGVVEDGEMFLSGNTFYVSTGSTNMKGYRATFAFDGITLPTDNSAARINWIVDENGETTSIHKLIQDKDNNEFYNLSGQRVVSPQKGFYITKGRKVVIK